MSIDRQKKLAELVEAFDGYMAQLKALHQRLEAGGKDQDRSTHSLNGMRISG
jgi:hypothetical protein